MKDCLFCNIIKGEQASYTLYEDDDLKVIMDAFPNSPGHTLIIPKEHYKDLDDIDIELLTKILKKAKDIKKLLETKLNPESIILVFCLSIIFNSKCFCFLPTWFYISFC